MGEKGEHFVPGSVKLLAMEYKMKEGVLDLLVCKRQTQLSVTTAGKVGTGKEIATSGSQKKPQEAEQGQSSLPFWPKIQAVSLERTG